MENLGALAILLAFGLSVYSVLANLTGRRRQNVYLIRSGERAVYAIWGLLSLASALLVYALLTDDFRLAYVAKHSNRDLPTFYKFTAWWGGQEGSLLLWSWILASYASLVVYLNRHRLRDIMPYVTSVLMVTQAFFLLLIAIVARPFDVLAVGEEVIAVPDGRGLNPLLQHWAMAAHPPALYLGYVGFTVPFAFAMGSLIARAPGNAWIHVTRRWTLITWGFQTAGICIGAAWAYTVLGWGGYWGWDPVENASLLPWITATAFLHSVMMQEKKGMMKIWNVGLISGTFLLAILGTFITRSGLVSSVHAFAQSSIGAYFAVFLGGWIGVIAYLMLSRLDYLRTEARLESVISRESAFLFNNLILLASCFAILWGTLFPVISEAFTGQRVSVSAPFFNRVNVPIGLLLLFLTGVGPLIAWRRSSWESLRRIFLWPAVAGLVTVGGLLLAGVRHFYALIALGLCAFVAWTIGSEFVKGALVIRARTGSNLLASMVELTLRNTRRYGGYIVHLGVVLLFVGFSGAAFNQKRVVEVRVGDHFEIGRYQLQVSTIEQGETPNYEWERAIVQVYRNGHQIDVLRPERRFYKSSQQTTSEVSVRRRLNEDLYLNFAGMTEDRQRAVIDAYVFPLVNWIWIGFWVMMVGTAVCLLPSKARVQKEREPALEAAEVPGSITG